MSKDIGKRKCTEGSETLVVCWTSSFKLRHYNLKHRPSPSVSHQKQINSSKTFPPLDIRLSWIYFCGASLENLQRFHDLDLFFIHCRLKIKNVSIIRRDCWLHNFLWVTPLWPIQNLPTVGSWPILFKNGAINIVPLPFLSPHVCICMRWSVITLKWRYKFLAIAHQLRLHSDPNTQGNAVTQCLMAHHMIEIPSNSHSTPEMPPVELVLWTRLLCFGFQSNILVALKSLHNYESPFGSAAVSTPQTDLPPSF